MKQKIDGFVGTNKQFRMLLALRKLTGKQIMVTK